MIESYRVGVTLALDDQLTPIMARVIEQLKSANAAANALKKTLGGLGKTSFDDLWKGTASQASGAGDHAGASWGAAFTRAAGAAMSGATAGPTAADSATAGRAAGEAYGAAFSQAVIPLAARANAAAQVALAAGGNALVIGPQGREVSGGPRHLVIDQEGREVSVPGGGLVGLPGMPPSPPPPGSGPGAGTGSGTGGNATNGYLSVATGYEALRASLHGLMPSLEYRHQVNVMQGEAGIEPERVSWLENLAFKETNEIPGSTATGNLRSIMDLRNVVGANKKHPELYQEVEALLPIMLRTQAVLSASKDERVKAGAPGLALGIMKALDIRGANLSIEQIIKETELMTKTIQATGGRVTPEMYKGTLQYARQAKFDLTTEFLYGILPSLIWENAHGKDGAGGGSHGVGPMLAAFYRRVVSGTMSKSSEREFKELGLVTNADQINHKKGIGPMIKDRELAAQDQFKWDVEVLVPAIIKKYGDDPAVVRDHLAKVFEGNQLAASEALEFYMKRANFERDRENFREATGFAGYDAARANDPYTAMNEVGAQFHNLQVALGESVPGIMTGLGLLSTTLLGLKNVAHDNPGASAGFVAAVVALAGSLGIAGVAKVLASSPWLKVALGRAGWVGLTLTGLGAAYDAWNRVGDKTRPQNDIPGPIDLARGIWSALNRHPDAAAVPAAPGSDGQTSSTHPHSIHDIIFGRGITAPPVPPAQEHNSLWDRLFHPTSDAVTAPARTQTREDLHGAVRQGFEDVIGRLRPEQHPINVATTVTLDGRAIGRAVAQYLGTAASLPGGGRSSPDLPRTPLYPGTGGRSSSRGA